MIGKISKSLSLIHALKLHEIDRGNLDEYNVYNCKKSSSILINKDYRQK